MNKFKLAFATLLAATTFSAQAGVVYDNGAATDDSYRCAESSGRCGAQWAVYDNFTLTANTTISAINWTSYLYGGTTDFGGARAWIYSANPTGANATLLHTIGVQTNALVANQANRGYGAYNVALTGLDIDLNAGTYWLGMQNRTFTNYATIARTGSGQGNSSQRSIDSNLNYTNTNGPEYAFKLQGGPQADVPEPASIALLGVALLGFGLSRRRAQK